MSLKLFLLLPLLLMAAINPLATALVAGLLLGRWWQLSRALRPPSVMKRHRLMAWVVIGFTMLNISFIGIGYLRHALGGSEGAPGDQVAFAPYGDGYATYSWLGNGPLGRQYTRRDVREIVTRAFAERSSDEALHLLAETGLRTGESLSFHASHVNGRAVDVHLPVRWSGERTLLPSNPLTVWGYLWRFDKEARSSALAWDLPSGCEHAPLLGLSLPMPPVYDVDFDELARLLAAVIDADRAVKTTRLQYVILWKPYVRLLKANDTYKALFGRSTKRRGPSFRKSCAKPIHDEHIHLHFSG